jgi:NADH:ubiquinone oxidoreductase subunit C
MFNKEEVYELGINRMLRIDNYFSLFNRVRYTIIESSSKQPFYSCSTIFKNAIWLEREFLEMYGPLLNTIYDTRNLLLEYSFTDNPMLKTYPTEGFVDIYYDFFRDQLCYVNHDYVEL